MDHTEIIDMATAVTMGRMQGTQAAKIVRRAPLSKPADPIPVTVRPTTNMELDLDAAQIMLPVSNTTRKVR
jgi:hypothetical protein